MPASPETSQPVVVRRAPKYGVFLSLGTMAGVVLALVAAQAGQPPSGFSDASIWGFFALFGGALGLSAGAVVALILDRLLSRRARTVRAERSDRD